MKKIMEEQTYLCVQIFNTDKGFYSGKKTKKATNDISEESTRIKAGTERLTLLVCANKVSFYHQDSSVYKVTNAWVLKTESNTSRQLRQQLYTDKAWRMRFFWTGFMDVLSLKSGSTLLGRDCLLKFLWYWTMTLATQKLRSSTPTVSKWSTCPQTQCVLCSL